MVGAVILSIKKRTAIADNTRFSSFLNAVTYFFGSNTIFEAHAARDRPHSAEHVALPIGTSLPSLSPDTRGQATTFPHRFWGTPHLGEQHREHDALQ
jgi:hypothetical protein